MGHIWPIDPFYQVYSLGTPSILVVPYKVNNTTYCTSIFLNFKKSLNCAENIESFLLSFVTTFNFFEHIL